MTKYAIILLVVVLVAGCGGSLMLSIGSSPFAGDWEGKWSGFTLGLSSTMDITVESDGGITGTIDSWSTVFDPTVSGTIDSGGNAVFAYVYNGDTYSVRGRLTENGSGHLTGTLTEYKGDSSNGFVTVDLSPKP